MIQQVKVCMLHTKYRQMKNYVYVGIDTSTRKAFLVDPVWELDKIEQCCRQEKVILDKIFLTHSHIDHVQLADTFARKYDIPVFMSEQEIAFSKYSCYNLHSFVDNDTITVGNIVVQCFVTPGHTVGGACFLTGKHIFTGDTLFIEGCGFCQFHGGSATQMYNSVQRLKELPDDTKVYPAHQYNEAPGVTMKFVKNNNIYMSLDDREEFIKFRNRKNITGLFSFK